MVCPNCKSDKIIEVQGQHFCINCGQAVPAPAPKPGARGELQPNGLPAGVKILAASGIPADTTATATQTEAAAATPDPEPAEGGAALVKARTRIRPVAADDESVPGEEPAQGKSKPRKPGRPKAGPLDAPKGTAAPAAALPDAPQLGAPKTARAPDKDPSTSAAAAGPTPPTPAPPAADAPLSGPRRMSDIAPRSRHAGHAHAKAAAADAAKPADKPGPKNRSFFSWPARPKPAAHKQPPTHAHHVHKVGVPPLHYGAIITSSLRARVRPRLIGLASLAAVAFAAAIGYGTWLILTQGLNRLASNLQHLSPVLIAQLSALAALYYVGRSAGQAAITYGVARDADQRPVSLSRQLGTAINTFGRRLTLDIMFAIVEITLLVLVGGLMLTGGQTWPVNVQLQIGALFVAFLVLLYLLTAVAITRGLAAVAITLTTEDPKTAVKLGWRLFSHRFELLALRFLAAAMEILLAVPLAALALAFVSAAPASMHLAVTLGVAVVAWLAGALIGAGTATWWTLLYRQLILVDHSDGAVSLLSGRHSADANRAPLALLVSVTTLLVAIVLILPWLKL